MKDRIRKIRKEAGLTQSQFGAIIGVAQTTIAGYENGSREVPNSAIVSICREFGINDKWLRTGEGPMKEQSLIYRGIPPEFAPLVGKFLSLDPETQTKLLSVAEQLISALKNPEDPISSLQSAESNDE